MPSRVPATSDRYRSYRLHPHRFQMIVDHLLGQAAGRRATPCGISPVVTIRHSATSSLRANATIMVLRVPLRRSCHAPLGASLAMPFSI